MQEIDVQVGAIELIILQKNITDIIDFLNLPPFLDVTFDDITTLSAKHVDQLALTPTKPSLYCQIVALLDRVWSHSLVVVLAVRHKDLV